MNQKITVEEAITKGYRLIYYPISAIVIITMLISSYLVAKEIMSFWIFPISVLFIMPLMICLYWCFVITKWRLWSFENVRNVHELKKRAIQERLIGKDNSFIEKIEIRTARQNAKWDILLEKFKYEDIFYNDPTIPSETIICYSKSKNYFFLLLFVLTLSINIFLTLKNQEYITGSIIAVVLMFLIFKSFIKVINSRPQIIINEHGIMTDSKLFYEWKYIKNIDVIRVGSGKHESHYLVYGYPDGSVKLNMGDLNINRYKFIKLLSIYQGRYNKKNYNA